MKIAFLDAATMGDVSFEPFERLGDFTRYENSTPEASAMWPDLCGSVAGTSLSVPVP